MRTKPLHRFHQRILSSVTMEFLENTSHPLKITCLIYSYEENGSSPCGLMIRHFPPEEKIAGSSPASDCFFSAFKPSPSFLLLCLCEGNPKRKCTFQWVTAKHWGKLPIRRALTWFRKWIHSLFLISRWWFACSRSLWMRLLSVSSHSTILES